MTDDETIARYAAQAQENAKRWLSLSGELGRDCEFCERLVEDILAGEHWEILRPAIDGQGPRLLRKMICAAGHRAELIQPLGATDYDWPIRAGESWF